MSKTDIQQRLKTICSATLSIYSIYIMGSLHPVDEASMPKAFFNPQQQTITFTDPMRNTNDNKLIAVPTNTPINIKNVEIPPQKNGNYNIGFRNGDNIQMAHVKLQISTSPELTGAPAIAPQEEKTSEVLQAIEQIPESEALAKKPIPTTPPTPIAKPTSVPEEKVTWPIPTTQQPTTPTPVPIKENKSTPIQTPTEEPKSWYSQAWESIVDFLYGFFKFLARGGG